MSVQREEQGRNERKLDLVAKMADESECRTNVDVKMMGGLVGWFETFPGEKPTVVVHFRKKEHAVCAVLLLPFRRALYFSRYFPSPKLDESILISSRCCVIEFQKGIIRKEIDELERRQI